MAIETLGDALDRGWTLRLHCREGKGAGMRKHRACVASLEADLETLVWTRGRSFPITRLDSHLKCPRCGSRRVSITLVVPNEPASAAVPAGPHWTKRLAG